MAAQDNRVLKKNRFIALGNKKVCFLNLARKLGIRLYFCRHSLGGVWVFGRIWNHPAVLYLLLPSDLQLNVVQASRGRQETKEHESFGLLVRIRKRGLSFQKKGRGGSSVPVPVPYCGQSGGGGALVKDLIDYTRCDQCLANIKIRLLLWIYFPINLHNSPLAWEWKN